MRKVAVIFIFCSYAYLKPYIITTAVDADPEDSKVLGLVAGTLSAYALLHYGLLSRYCPEYFDKGLNEDQIRQGNDSHSKQAMKYFHPNDFLLDFSVFICALCTPEAARNPSLKVPKLNWKELIKPFACALVFVASSSLSASIVGYKCAADNDIQKEYKLLKEGISIEALPRFIATDFAQRAARKSGVLASISVIVWIIYERHMKKRLENSSQVSVK